MKLLLLFCLALFACQDASTSCPSIEVRFSPGGNITNAIVQAIDNSQSSALIQAYSFTQERIAKSLVAAKQRGERVEVIIDKGDAGSRRPLIEMLVNGGVIVLLDGKHPIAHSKTLILDEAIVFTGSSNFTNGAEKNAENSLKISDKKIAQLYTENWELHRKHSTVYKED
jgi:phosphatidylserine/phosphatidylglycerophosphate/cardiolipin synthase-like enzyme